MPHDLTVRDAEFVRAAVDATHGMMLALRAGDNPGLIGHLNLLLAALITHRDACAERPSDEPLRRAVRRMSGTG